SPAESCAPTVCVRDLHWSANISIREVCTPGHAKYLQLHPLRAEILQLAMASKPPIVRHRKAAFREQTLTWSGFVLCSFVTNSLFWGFIQMEALQQCFTHKVAACVDFLPILSYSA